MSDKDLKAQADLLRRSGKFDPARATKVDPQEALRELRQADRNAEAFAAAKACPACTDAREKRSDPEALCDQHFAAAMGF